jgi:hypothetical protein
MTITARSKSHIELAKETTLTISLDGASLLATLFPVGLLIVAVEARGAGPLKGPGYSRGDGWRAYVRWLTSSRNTIETLFVLAVSYQLFATVVCVVHVCASTPIESPWAMYVAIAGVIGLLGVFVALGRLLRGLAEDEPNRE